MPDPQTTLKPCPFCASTNIVGLVAYRDSEDRLFPIARCMSCYAQASGKNDDYSQNAKTAVEAWNRRSYP